MEHLAMDTGARELCKTRVEDIQANQIPTRDSKSGGRQGNETSSCTQLLAR
jgi:hypothetical protein